jgi:hypothetical protein
LLCNPANICHAIGQPGDACHDASASASDCASGLCVHADGAFVCADVGTEVGQRCDPALVDSCGGPERSGLFCDNTSTCAAIVIVDNGTCDDGHICKLSFSSRICDTRQSPPVCADLPTIGQSCGGAALGECASTSGTLTRNTSCDITLASPVCEATPGLGGTCSAAVPCSDGLVCSTELTCVDPNTIVCPVAS